MSLPYYDGDTRDEIQLAHDSNTPDEVIAGQLGIGVEELCGLMQWPQWKPVPASNDDEFCLFAGAERLGAQL